MRWPCPRKGQAGKPPRRLSAADLAAAKALLRDPTITVEEVARRLRVGPATLCRYLPGGRSAGRGQARFLTSWHLTRGGAACAKQL